MIYQRKVFRSFGRVRRDKRPRHCKCGSPLRMKQELDTGNCMSCMIDALVPKHLRVRIEVIPEVNNGDN